MLQYSTKTLLLILLVVASYFSGYATQIVSTKQPDEIQNLLIDDPAISDFAFLSLDPNYSPGTFWADLELLVENKRFGDAVALLDFVVLDEQIKHDGSNSYCAVGGCCGVHNLGTDSKFDPNRDIKIPGTCECTKPSVIWDVRAMRFAIAYNRRLDQLRYSPDNNALDRSGDAP